MTSPSVRTLLTTTWHTPDDPSEVIMVYGLPFLNKGIGKGLHTFWWMLSLSDTSRKHVPIMFYWIEVWGPGWPVHHSDTFVIQEGHGQSSCVGTCIILHYNECITNCACIWSDNRLHNLITISYCGYNTSGKHIQICTTI